jgi:hypothetical protein
MLYHVSEQSGITHFEPRPAANLDYPVVWAVHEDILRNYLLPRDCPRVTFFAGPKTTPLDVERFLGSSPAVVAIESVWLDRVRSTQLFCYRLPDESFRCVDKCAGYFHSRDAVTPLGVDIFEDSLGAIAARGAEIRTLPSLLDLHDAVVASTLSFSIIRMRNAAQRSDLGQKPAT